MNRALERISPKPMVDGLSKSLFEFRSGCDEKSDTISPHLQVLHFYRIHETLI